jgi:hypothetical protein
MTKKKIVFKLDEYYTKLPPVSAWEIMNAALSAPGTTVVCVLCVRAFFSRRNKFISKNRTCLRGLLLFFFCFSLLPPFLYTQRTLPNLSRLPGGAAGGPRLVRI